MVLRPRRSAIRDQGGVGSAEGKGGVGLDEVADAFPVVATEGLDPEVTIDDGRIERGFGFGAELAIKQVGGLGDDHGGGDERAGVTVVVATVALISSGDQHAGVDDQHDSAAAEPIREELIDAMGGSRTRSADADDRESAVAPAPLGWESVGELGDHHIDRDATAGRFGLQAPQRFRGKINGH